MCKLKFVCLVIPLILSLYKGSNAQILKEQAIDIVLVNIVAGDSLNFNVYLYPDICHENIFDPAPYLSVQNPYDSAWIFFVDCFPVKGWGHHCKYVIVDKVTGQLTLSNDNIPPRLYWLTWEEISVPFPHQFVIQSTDTTFKTNSDYEPDPNKYALLITWNAWEDTARWNNLSHIYTGLKLTYGFTDENIFVLSDDGFFDQETQGLNLDDIDNICDFDGPCTKDSIEDIFSFLQSEMNEEDLFFFYATTHGDTLDGDLYDTTALVLWDALLWDYELEEMIENIQCSQKIFCIDACYAGGFVDELSGNHSVVNVPVPRDVETLRSWNHFDFFSYAWGTAVRGKHPKDEIEPYYAIYNIGEHPDLTLVFNEWDKADTLPDLQSFGGNEDGFIQFGEAFKYAKYIDGQTQVSGIEYNNDGFLGDLLTLNGIEGRVDTTQYVSGPYLIGRKLTIAPNVTLSNNNHTNFYLNDSSEIYVSENAFFNPYGYWTDIIGCSGNSLINVKGSLRSSVMDFSANPGASMNIHFENMNNDYDFSYFDFNNCRVSGAARSLSFDESSFTHSSINFTRGDLVLSDRNEFIHSAVTLSDPGSHSSSCTIIGNSFDNDHTVAEQAVISLEDYCNFLIEGNEIFYDANRGIELFYAGWDATSNHAINDNTIHFTGTLSGSIAELGIHAYYSDVDIHNNKIQYNDYGITGFHRSELTVLGDSLAQDIDSTQLIGDNTRSQCLFNISTFPTEFHWNVIRDVSMGDKPFIKVVEFDEMIEDTSEVKDWIGDSTFHVEYNCWVNDTNPEDRLVPVGAYTWRPAWCPGSGHLRLQNEPELMYYTALSEIEDDNYSVAEYGFKQIIAGYPDNKYAHASLKGLFALNPALYDTNYSFLEAYCDSLSSNPGDSLLGTTANWISIHCKIKNKHYQQAINALDSVISNAGTLADSVFALIDLNYVYLQTMDSSNLKSFCITKNENVLAKTYENYKVKRKDWIELLFMETVIESDDDIYPLHNTPDHQPVQFRSIYPNPASKQVNISFEVFKQEPIELSLYSITGQQLFNLNLGTRSAGDYLESLSLTFLPEGMYLITLSTNGVNRDNARVVRTK